MRDERRDSGQYYPGGRVIARPGTAPQQVVVQWSDVQNKPQVAPLPERYKDSDVKTKINEIASKFATVVVAAFVVWTACADVTVQKKRKDEIYNDELVVVDVSGEGVGINTNAVEQIANVAVVTNALTVATTNRVAALETATNNLTSSVSGLQSSKADKSTTYTKSETDAKLAEIDAIGVSYHGRQAYGDVTNVENGLDYAIQTADDAMTEATGRPTYEDLNAKANRAESGDADEIATLDADGNPTRSGKNVSDFAPAVIGGYIPYANSYIQFSDYGYTQLVEPRLRIGNFTKELIENNGVLCYGDGDPSEKELAVKGDIPVISATDQTFSNEVVKVQMLSLSTNITAEVYIAATNACANLGIDPALIPGEGTVGTVGGFIVIIFTLVLWMRRKIFDNSGKVNDAFAGELLGKQVAKEAIIYKANTATGLKDRAFNALSLDGTEYNLSTALAAVTPTVVNQPRDLLIVATATAQTTISYTAGTIKGDKPTIDGAGTWLITLTEYASGVWYCRQIKMEDAQ